MILCTHSVEESVGLVFTNYDIAYVGKQFSQSFLKWIDIFSHDILNAYSTRTKRYIGSVVSISSLFYHMSNGEIVMYITNISFNPIQLAIVRGNTLAERARAGIVTTPPTLIATRRSVTDYSYYCDGGTYYGHPISIVKNKRSNKNKLRFKYYDTVTRNIMFDYEFYSAFPFVNNEANAWATDGHKYLLPLMLFIESKIRQKIIKNKSYNTMNNTKKRIRLTESDLHRLIKEAINEYGGYDSLKQAYGEHDSLPFMRHLRRVGMEPGYTRTDAERFKMQDRQERNRQNLDPLHLKAVQKIPQDVRDMNQYRDMRLNVTEAKKSQSRPLPFYYQEPKKAKDSVRGRYLRYSPEDSNFSSEGENFGWIMQDSYNESEMNKLIDDALTSLNKAREYAKDGGHGRWYTLLNAICGELYHRVQNTDVRGLGPYAANSNIDM